MHTLIRRWHGIALACGMTLFGCADAASGFGDADNLTRQGAAHIEQGRYADAEAAFRRAVSIRERAGGAETPAAAQAAYNLGYVYRLEGRYTEAEPLLQRALAIRERASSPLIPQYLSELAYVYQSQGRYNDAEPIFARALSILRRANRRDEAALATALINLGYLYRLQARYQEAEQYYRDGLEIRERLLGPQHPDVAQAADNLGVIYRLEGRYSLAEPLLRRALAIREKASGATHPDVADSLNDLGDLYRAQKRYADAETALRRALAIDETALGQAHPYLATHVLESLSVLYEAEGRQDEALAVSSRSVDVLRRHLGASMTRRYGGAAAERRLYRAGFLRNIALLYGSRPNSANFDATADRSFQVAQLATASTAAQAVAGLAARLASGTNNLAAKIRQLQDLEESRQQLDTAIAKTASRPLGSQGTTEQVDSQRSADSLERAILASEASISVEFPNYAKLTNPAPLPIGAVQSLLAPDEAMLVYLIGDEASWLWVIRRDRSTFLRIDIGSAALTAEVTALRARLDPWQNPSLRPFPAARSYALFRRLVAPAISLLQGATRIIVVPDGALQSLPMGVLVTQPPPFDPAIAADHRGISWFARDHAITVLPSVGSLLALRSVLSTSRAPSPFIGIGDPTLGGPSTPDRSGRVDATQVIALPPIARQARLFRGASVDLQAVKELPPLPETSGELRTIAQVLGASDGDLYLGDRASEPVIRGARLDRYRIIEFATHGLMSGDLGLGEPALVLTPPDIATSDNDGLLTASKIATMTFDADWVVLSACNTASTDGTPDAGGLTGLARAFFYAGARSMLVSHWSVNSRATVKITTGAFAALARDPGIGRAEALRRSMMAMFEPSNPPDYAHPMFWAPFVLAGEGGAGR